MESTEKNTSKWAAQYKHPKWQKKRLEVLERDGFKCRKCGADDKPLHVHHFEYVKGRKVWEYKDHELITLCDGCHSEIHKIQEVLFRQVGYILRLCCEESERYSAKDFNDMLSVISGSMVGAYLESWYTVINCICQNVIHHNSEIYNLSCESYNPEHGADK